MADSNKLNTILVLFIFVPWFIITGSAFTLSVNLIITPILVTLLFSYLYRNGFEQLTAIGYSLFFTLLTADALQYSSVELNHQLSYFCLTTIFLLFIKLNSTITNEPKRILLSIIYSKITFLFLLIPMIYITYVINYKTPMNKNSFYAMAQTNIKESLSYLIFDVSVLIWVLVLTAVIIFTLLYNKHFLIQNKLIEKKFIYLASMILILALTANYEYLRLFKDLSDSVKSYSDELQTFKVEQIKTESIAATKQHSGETHVVIIGESLSKNHMSLYDYPRNTTPELSALNGSGEIITFDNVFSNHTHTMQTLSLALTEANQYNKNVYYKSASILNILNSADFEIFWLTNQDINTLWDNHTTIISQAADHFISTTDPMTISELDEKLIPELTKIVEQKSSKNRVIFIHLMGSHHPYQARYPDNFKKFKTKTLPELLNEIGSELYENSYKDISREHEIPKLINYYDNSVLYNDYVISAIIKQMKKMKGLGTVLYFSDHGEDVLNGRHNSSLYNQKMTEIPCCFWANKQFKALYTQKMNWLLKRKRTFFCNDMIYDTLIGLYDIKTERYNPIYDFTSDNYQVPQKPVSLHGKVELKVN